MRTLTVSEKPDQSWGDLVPFWEDMEWPEGNKVEIIEGIITVSPAPACRHNLIASDIQRRLYSVIPEDWGIFQRLAIAVPSCLGMLMPDLVVTPLPDDAKVDTHIPAGLAELVVEVTSRASARHDRVSKAVAYATAGIPLYLLVDNWAPGGPTVTLYGEPKGDVYRVLRAGKFGDPIELPAPFDLVIDTEEFPVG
ncbi:Uma2 family endonuclease [Streptomyces sp. RY43-2]|uniref:Uma2 family endonuclease n=1 Tax=Streptomyces macrolidinus TaxID=2952607 RepID=A0ABT0ZJR9_9ACTN|nr:Uma2 family endonuclease [Streptomyces macrolidinus]MCN9243832.1 Uma2 family endonuclease [Streptomyces macrolidinus]